MQDRKLNTMQDTIFTPDKLKLHVTKDTKTLIIFRAIKNINDMQAIINFLNQNPNITNLSLRMYIQNEQVVAYFAENSPASVTMLNLAENELSEDVIEAFAKNNKTVTRLSLEESILTNKKLEAFFRNNKTVTVLDIKKNGIDSEGATIIAKNNTTVKQLDISFNEIGVDGAKALAQNPTITMLDVSHNDIFDEGMQYLTESSTITALKARNNCITPEGVKGLAQNQTLTTLDVGENFIGDEGAKYLAQCTGIRVLGMQKDKMLSQLGITYLTEKNPINVANAEREKIKTVEVPTLVNQCLFKINQLGLTTEKLPKDLQDSVAKLEKRSLRKTIL